MKKVLLVTMGLIFLSGKAALAYGGRIMALDSKSLQCQFQSSSGIDTTFQVTRTLMARAVRKTSTPQPANHWTWVQVIERGGASSLAQHVLQVFNSNASGRTPAELEQSSYTLDTARVDVGELLKVPAFKSEVVDIGPQFNYFSIVFKDGNQTHRDWIPLIKAQLRLDERENGKFYAEMDLLYRIINRNSFDYDIHLIGNCSAL